MGRLNSSKRYLYVATGMGLSPNINGLRFYDSGTTYYTNKVFYDETNTYAMWISPVGYWFIGLISANRDTPGNCFAKSVNNSGEPPTGNYIGSNGFSGTVTISLYVSNKNISINKQNLGGGRLIGGPYTSPANIVGLQAFYNFEQTVPNSQLDSSGNGRHLTYQVNTLDATSTTGKINSCVSFTSSPPGIRNQGSKYRTTSWGPNVSSNFSLSVWLKPRSFDAYQHIIGAPFSNRLYIGANGTTLTFNLFNGTTFGIAAPVVTLNTWHHYVFIRNGTTLLLYADNVFIGSTSVAGQSFSPGTAEFHVGGSGPFNEYYYDGDVDALGVWNVVLTQNQINYLWSNGQGVQMS